MRRILLTLVCILSFALLAEAQWTATNGPFGGYITSLRRSTTGTLYAVINSQLYQSTNNGDSWTITSSSLFLQDLLIDSDGKMYAVYFSTFYVSTDNGANWTTVSSNAFQGVQRIDKFGPAGVFATWGSNGFYVSTNKGTTWTQISSQSFSSYVESAFAANAAGDIYYAASNGTIYKHLYGTGTNWSAANMVATGFPAGETIYSMAIDAASRIYVGSGSDIRISTNGGTSFTSIKAGLSPTTSFYGPIAVSPDGVTVWLFNNSDNKVYKSANQGSTWTNTSTSPTVTYGSQVRNVVFASASTFFVGSTSDGVFRTNDTGVTWAFKSSGLTFGNINELEVANTTNKIIAVKGGNGYWSSTDAGATWIINPIADYVTHVMKLANGNILLYGSRVYRSTDNGATFTPSALYYYHYKIVEASNGDLYGFSYGKLAKSTDSGVTWTDVTLTGYSATMQGNFAAIDGTTNIMVHGYDNGTYKTFKISGTTASLLTLPVSGSFNNVFFLNNTFYCSNFSAIYSSTDLGTTWSTIGFSGNFVFPIKNVTYSGIAVAGYGSLYISQDGGGSWNNTTMPNSSSYITDVATDASGNYYATASGSSILKFTGSLLVDPLTLPPFINFNWQPLKGPYGGSIARVRPHPNGTDFYAIANNFQLWKYTAGVWTRLTPTGGALTPTTTIFDVELDAAGTTIYITTNSASRLLKSTDGAATWSVLTGTGLPSTVRKLEVLSDGSMIAFSSNKILRSTDNGASFTLKYTSTTSTTFARNPAISSTEAIASFVSPLEGIVISTDKGLTWNAKSTSAIFDMTLDPISGSPKGSMSNMMFDNLGNLVVAGFYDITPAAPISKLYKSVDNGANWTTMTDPVPGLAGFGKRVVALPTGEYIATVNSYFDYYRSTDRGVTWSLAGNVGDVFAFSEWSGTTAYVLGGVRGLQKTTDGGLNFSTINNGMPINTSSDIAVLNNKDLLVGATSPYHSSDFGQSYQLATAQVAGSFLILGDSIIGYGSRLLQKSKDGGKTWTPFGVDRFFSFLTKDALGNGYYAYSNSSLPNTTIQEGLFYSTDMINWTQIQLSGLPTGVFMAGMVIDSSGVIYAVMSDNSGIGKIYKLVFGSAIDITQTIGSNSPSSISYYNNKIYLYDSDGIIFKSTDGETWTRTSAPSGNRLIITSNGYLFVPGGSNLLWLSRNDGGAWQSVGDIPSTSQSFNKVAINEYDGYAYATSSGTFTRKSGNIVMPDDKTKPVVSTLSPANNGTGAGLLPKLSITFDEITKAVAGKKIRVFDLAQPAVPVATMDMSAATQVDKTWSVVTNASLSLNKTYFVVVDPGAVTDIFGNAFLGISTSTVWRFTTKGNPTVANLAPNNAATNVLISTTFAITFSEPVNGVGGKNIKLYKTSSPATPVASIDAGTGVLSGNKLTYTPPANALQYNTVYFITADASAFTTVDGGVFSAVILTTDWTFTTSAPPDVQAPTITFLADPLQKGAGNKVFSVSASDNVGISSVMISYRSITSSSPVTTASLTFNGATGKYDITIPEASFGPMGLEFYFTATDAATNAARSPATGNHYSYINYPPATSPQIPGGLIGVGGKIANWRIISVPHNLSDTKISTVFSELGADDFSKWRLITYKTQTAWDQYPNDFSTFTQGKGYFINLLSATNLVVDGATTPSYNKETPFSLTLAPGWNQIGNPYTFPMKWSEVLAANSNPAGVATTLKVYKGTYQDADQLDVFEGGFVLNSGSSNVNVTIPIVGSLAGGRLESPSYNLSDDRWIAPISVTVGEQQSVLGGVGMHPQASVGVDTYDDFTPPAIGDYAQLNFAHPEHFLKVATRDVVPTMPAYTWKFTVEATQSGKGHLDWNPENFGSGSNELYLMDVTLQRVVDMRVERTYVFDASSSNSFKIYFGKDLKDSVKPDKVTLGNAYPNPSTGRTIIPFTLPNSSPSHAVRLELYDVLGQQIGTLIQGELAPGFYQQEWNNESTAQPGLYTYRLVVSGQQGAETLHGKIVIKK